MSVIVTDEGFQPDSWNEEFSALDTFLGTTDRRAVDLGPDTDLNVLIDKIDTLKIIRIAFPSFADGRGFTLARRLRLMGYTGRLRATGHVISDQYAMARRSGFDEVEISDDLAARQPVDHWLARSDWAARDYQARMRG